MVNLPTALDDREKQKFELNSSEKVAVRTLSEIVGAVSGSFTFSGLSTAIKISNITVTDTPTALPITALTNRNTLILENRDAILPIYIGDASVSNSGINEGWEVLATSQFATDITDAINLYAIAPAGQSITVKIMELA